ncbi:MAG: hypothetical protein ABH828_05300 [archaeon]
MSSTDYKEIKEFFKQLEKKNIKGNLFEEKFLYENVSMWNFFKQRFIKNTFPKHLDNYEKVVLRIKNKEQPKKSLKNNLLRKGFLANQLLKILITSKGKKTFSTKGKNKILFHANTNALIKKGKSFEIDRIQKIFDKVKQDKQLQAELILSDPLSHKASPKLLNFNNVLDSFITSKDINKARINSKKIHKEWKKTKKNISFKDAKEKVFFKQFGEHFDFYFSREILFITILYYEAFKKVISKYNFKAVIIYAADNITDKCLIYAADNLNVPTIRVPHGIGATAGKWDFPKSHYLLSIGPLQKNMLVKTGAPEKNIIVTGPVLSYEIKDFIRQQPERKKSEKIILFCTGPMIEENFITKKEFFKHMEVYIKVLSKIKDYKILIKPHPLEKNLKDYLNIIKKHKIKNISLERASKGKEHLYKLINKCDLFISVFSTTLWEANIMGKTTILIGLYPKKIIDKEGVFHKTSDCVIKVKTGEELLSAVKIYLYDKKKNEELKEKRKEFLDLYCYKCDGLELERMMQSIKKIIFKNKQEQN